MFKGSCLCGEVVFSVTEFSTQMAHCHCEDCRKFHGAAFSTFGHTLCRNVTWHDGAEQLKTFVAKNGSKRQFCLNCGSSLTFQSANHSDEIEIALATLHNSETLLPDAHVFTSSKVPWVTINDALPNYDRNRQPKG